MLLISTSLQPHCTFMWQWHMTIFSNISSAPFPPSLFNLWDSNYTFIRLFDIIPQLLEALALFSPPHHSFFSFCFSLGDFYCPLTNSLVLPLVVLAIEKPFEGIHLWYHVLFCFFFNSRFPFDFLSFHISAESLHLFMQVTHLFPLDPLRHVIIKVPVG